MDNILEKKVRVCLLKTDLLTNIIFDKKIFQWIKKPQIAETINSSVCGFYLYFLSDEQIEKNDWYCDTSTSTIHKCDWDRLKRVTQNFKDVAKKIIATTNPELDAFRNEKLPQIPLYFITQYIDSCNTNKYMSPVIVQYKRTEFWGNDGSVFPIQYCANVTNENMIIIISHTPPKFEKPTLKELCETDADLKNEVIELLYKHTSDLLNGYRNTLEQWITTNV